MITRVYSTNTRLKMSNLTSFILAVASSIVFIWGFYCLIKKWSKFHTTLFGKVLKVLYAFILLIAITISLIAAYHSFDSYWEDDRLRVVTEFQGVRLGWSKDEVLFRKGEPTDTDAGNKHQELIYGAMTVMVDKNKVIAIQYNCKLVEYSHEKVGGISCNDDVNRIINHYGEAKNTAVLDDKLRRLYSYPKYNLAFELSKSKVDLLRVIDSKNSPEGYTFKSYPWKRFQLLEEQQAKSNVDDSDIAEYGGRFIEDDKSKKKMPITDEKNAEFQAKDDAEKLDDFDPDAYLAKKAAELNSSSTKQENNNTKQMPKTKLRLKEVDYDPFNLELDHCAPDIEKAERLRRLALKGVVRETGYQTYSTGNYEIVFNSNSLYRCR